MPLRDSPDQRSGIQCRLQRVIAAHSGRGGLGSSWADCLKMVRERHPSIATAMIEVITKKS